MTTEQASLGKSKKKKANGGSRTLWIVLGSVMVCGFVACVGSIAGLALLGPAIENTMEEIVAELELTPGAVSGSSGSYVSRGSISTGQTVSGTVGTFEDDGWAFQGQAGQRITIQAVATDNILDTQLFVYAPDDALIAENDDISFSNYDSEVTVTLQQDGEYRIIVSAFGSGGDYDLTVR